VVQIGPATDPVVEQTQISLVEARSLAGLPAARKATDASKPGENAVPLTVSGTVKLSPSLAKSAQPQDTLFVFARPAEGSRMPLAILRKQVKDLPFQFVLDDSTSMSPNARLSTSGKVIVGARISKSGNALPEAGDLVGQSAPVVVGTRDLAIEIRDSVKP
jgi:cytochrome c-type biogenesis protein CcmH